MSLRKLILNKLLLFVTVLGSMLPAAFAEPLYRMTLLPQDFTASRLNEAGQVVGTARGGAAIWSPASTTYLGALLPGSEGLAINNRGAITGLAAGRAFIHDGGGFSPIDLPYLTWATAINDAGQVAGFTSEGFGVSRAFVYDAGSVTWLGTLGGELSVANAINASGQVAGFASRPGDGDDWPDPARYATVYRDGSQHDLGSLGGRISEANDINDAGFVTGWSELADGVGERPFLFAPDAAGMIDLGSLGGDFGRANALNNAGTVVGLSDIGGIDGADYHAFVYGDGVMADLNALVAVPADWRLVTATDVNDAGQILAQACRGQGECRAVRLDLISAVPEPSSWALLATGLVLVLWRTCWRNCRRPGPAARHRAARAMPALLAATVIGPLAAPLASAAPQAGPGAQVGLQPEMQVVSADDTDADAGTQTGIETGVNADIDADADADALASPGRFRATFIPAELNAAAINEKGHVGGSNGAAAIWDGVAVRDYGALAPASSAQAINNHGHLAGFYAGSAHVFSPSGLRNVARGVLVGSSTFGVAINDSGAVAGGSAWGAGERGRGFVLANGVSRPIPSLGGDWSDVTAINRHGHVVGLAALVGDEVSPRRNHAYVYRDKAIRSLGTLGGRNSRANDINDAGQVVGSAETEADEEGNFFILPFLYAGGTMTSLGSLGGGYGEARGLNNRGAVVGDSTVETPDGVATHAFLHEGGAMHDLNALTALPEGWTLVTARDINDARQVLALACRDEECRFVRLEPVRKPCGC